MTLEDELSKIRAATRDDAQLQTAYQDLLMRLDRAETGARALKAGDAIPAFLLPDAEGRLVTSDDLLARGSLVINFFGGKLVSLLPPDAEGAGSRVAGDQSRRWPAGCAHPRHRPSPRRYQARPAAQLCDPLRR